MSACICVSEFASCITVTENHTHTHTHAHTHTHTHTLSLSLSLSLSLCISTPSRLTTHHQARSCDRSRGHGCRASDRASDRVSGRVSCHGSDHGSVHAGRQRCQSGSPPSQQWLRAKGDANERVEDQRTAASPPKSDRQKPTTTRSVGHEHRRNMETLKAAGQPAECKGRHTHTHTRARAHSPSCLQ